MASRTLDDLTELVIPLSIAAGGLYLVWWLTQSTTKLAGVVPDSLQALVDYDIPWVGEGDLIDRWTLNPGEVARMTTRSGGRWKKRATGASKSVTRSADRVSRGIRGLFS